MRKTFFIVAPLMASPQIKAAVLQIRPMKFLGVLMAYLVDKRQNTVKN